MTHPWKGPRHSSWASNTVLTGVALGLVLMATVIVDLVNGNDPPPTYLTGLLGVAAGAFFGAVGSDKGKRDAELEKATEQATKAAQSAKSSAEYSSDAALRAELKADILAEIAAQSHPETARRIPPPLIPRRLRDRIAPELLEEDDDEEGGS